MDWPTWLRWESPPGDLSALKVTDFREDLKAVHPSSNVTMGLSPLASSTQASPWRPKPTTYGCFLSDLTGFVAARRTGPKHQYHLTSQVPIAIVLGREFDPAIADCGYRAPLAPHLARLSYHSSTLLSSVWFRLWPWLNHLRTNVWVNIS